MDVKLVICPQCGKQFNVPVTRGNHSKYCSDSCRRKRSTEQARVNRKNWGCHVKPSVENCMRCPYKDCINNDPATEEERETLNIAVGIYTNKQETAV